MVRVWLSSDHPGIDARLGALVEELPRAWWDIPSLSDPAPEANLCEDLLLAGLLVDTVPERLLALAGEVLGHERASASPRLGFELSSGEPDALLLPNAAAGLLLGRLDGVSAEHWGASLGEDPRLAALPAGADLARALLLHPARRIGRRPELAATLADLTGPGREAESPPWMIQPLPAHRAAEALEHLAGAPTSLERMAALARLLEDAIERRVLRVAGAEIDLARELVHRVSLRLARPTPPGRQDWLQLEVACLRLGASVAYREAGDEAPPEQCCATAWRTGRWLLNVVVESPLLGADAELLAARMEAASPDELPVVEHPLWPDLLGAEPTSGVHLEEILLLGTLAPQVHNRRWRPAQPVLDGLRTIAARSLTSAEWTAERRAVCVPSEWPAPHVAPPLLARWLLVQAGASWLAHLGPDERRETLELLHRHAPPDRPPETWELGRVDWILVGLYGEHQDLEQAERAKLVHWWLAVAEGAPNAVPGGFALLGAALLPSLPGGRRILAVEIARRSPALWRSGVLKLVADQALGEGDDALLELALDALLGAIASGEATGDRRPAAVALLQVLRVGPEEVRKRFAARFEAAAGPDLREEPSVVAEWRRVSR